jgi:integrase
MFRHAQEVWKLPLPKNPLAGARVLNADKRRERRLREDELDRLLEAGKKTRNKLIIPIVRFALETAMRRGELLSLRWRDVDEQRATATLLETKNGYSRVIPLTDTALDILRSVAPEEKNEDSRVFPVRANALRLSWVRLTKRAKIDDLHFHDLRHEAISRFFEMGLSVPEVASISGHRDMRMLFRYAHASHASIRAKFCLRASNEGISVS